MDRVAVFVDSGHPFAQGSKELRGEKLERGHVVLNCRALIAAIKSFAEKVSGLPLLRVYWCDGTSQAPALRHGTSAGLPSIKVRLGFANSRGRRKGVDSPVVADMIALARDRATADRVLLSGDEDLRVGARQAQEHGARVRLPGMAPASGSQSRFLRVRGFVAIAGPRIRREVDAELDAGAFRPEPRLRPDPASSPGADLPDRRPGAGMRRRRSGRLRAFPRAGFS